MSFSEYSFEPTLPSTVPADLGKLTAILRLKRKDGSQAEATLIDKLIKPIPGIKVDKKGNYAVAIPRGDGSASEVMWSCHTDTVHRTDGVQSLNYYDGTIGVDKGECLGADDGAGLWLLLEMIEAKIPGYYVFHRNEEHGCQGALYRSQHLAHTVAGIKYAIAFDRKGTTSVITHQCANRTCSDAFANSLSDMLTMGHKPDIHGSFTDTYSYMDLIPECTNVSIGYENAHSPQEILNTTYLLELRDSILDKWDESRLVCTRVAEPAPKKDYKTYYKPSNNDYYGSTAVTFTPSSASLYMSRLVRLNPEIVAELLADMGVSEDELLQVVVHEGGVRPGHVRG